MSGHHSLLWLRDVPFGLDHILLFHLHIDGYLSCLPPLVMEKNAAMSMCAHILVWVPGFNSFGHMPRIIIAGVSFLNM